VADQINDVELRNAWMHFDERMDAAGVAVSTVESGAPYRDPRERIRRGRSGKPRGQEMR
jgi:hypothetical protein